MNLWHFVHESMHYRQRTYRAVMLGVMTATAVLTGALVVGDSMRGSLRHLALDRLQGIDDVMVVPGFFREELAGQVATGYMLRGHSARVETNPNFDALPAIFLQATLARNGQSGDQDRRIAGRVTVLGIGPDFWKTFATTGPTITEPLENSEIVLNAPLAEKLSVRVGDDVILRLLRPSDIPSDSALGRKKETVRSLAAMRVAQILPANGLGRFGLYPTQQIPDVAFVAMSALQKALDQLGKVNAIFVTFGHGDRAPPTDETHLLDNCLRPQLEDYGISIRRTSNGYFNVTSDRMLFDPPIEQAAEEAFEECDGQPTFTYLANYIIAGRVGKAAAAKDDKHVAKIPYSTITALDLRSTTPLGPFLDAAKKPIAPLADNEIILNGWAADDMAHQGVKLKPGDPIEIQYFDPESLHGQSTETTSTLRLKAIVEMTGAAVDPNLVPEVKGLTDRRSIADWNPPFRFDASRVRSHPPNDQDERYWKQYKALPKAFVSLTCGRKLWGSRFGDTTSWRIPAKMASTAETLGARLHINPAAEGFRFLPVKQMALAAASGSTDFDWLFLFFSFFIIAAAVMLVALLFKLGIDRQGEEIGLLLALGFSRRKVRWILLSEGLIVAFLGGVFGVAGGLAYAWLMLVGLQTIWLAAVVTPFLHLYVTAQSLLIGFAIGGSVSLVTIAWSLRQLRRLTVRRLLAGETTPPLAIEQAGHRRKWNWPRLIGWTCLALALALAISAFATHISAQEEQAEIFMSSAALVLIGELLLIWNRLRSDRGSTLVTAGRGALVRLAVRNAARHPLRSTLTIGLMAAATFLIIALSAFHLEPPRHGAKLDSGDGGFSLFAQTDLPIFQNLNSAEGRTDLGIDEKSNALLSKCDVVSFRAQSGEDASCLNLFQPRQPRVLGVSPAMITRGGFAFSASDAKTPEQVKNPWLLLKAPKTGATDSEPTPVILDETTATYILHLDGVGSTLDISDAAGRKVPLKVVGLLAGSVLQGDVLMSESALLQFFPATSGYRFFLIDTRDVPPAEVRAALENNLDDFGFDAESTADRLAALMAVQNTYLSAFQSLGGLGLLLGTIGLAVVQLRSVLERRGELALLRAAGFRRSRLAAMVMWENASLLVGGLAAGILAAIVAIAAQIFSGSAAIPWLALAATLVLVLVVGLLAGMVAVRATLRAPLIPALRGE